MLCAPLLTHKFQAILQATGIVPYTPSATATALKSQPSSLLSFPSDGPKKNKTSIVKVEHSDNENLPEEDNSDDDSEQEKEVLVRICYYSAYYSMIPIPL